MKKYITGLLMLAAGLIPAFGQSAPNCSLLVNKTDGQTVTYRFAEEPVATFNEGDMILTTADSQSVTYPMADIASLTFEADMTGVNNVAADKDGLIIDITATAINISGLQPSAPVRVYDMGGSLIADVKGNAEGTAVVPTESLPKGVYVVSAPGHAFKFIK